MLSDSVPVLPVSPGKPKIALMSEPASFHSQRINRSMTSLEWTYLLILSVLWGASFFFIEATLRDLPIFTIVFARLFLGALGLLAVMFFAGCTLPRNSHIWTACFIIGFFNNALPFGMLVWGQVHVDSSIAALLVATTPLFTVVGAHFLTVDERIALPRLLGILIGLLGVAVMIGVDFRDGWNISLLASFACLGTALSYGIANIYARRFLATGIPLLSAAAGQVLAASILLLPLALFIDRPWILPMPRASSWAALIAMGLFSTSLAYVLYFRVLATAGATNLSLVSLLVPISAVLLGVGILEEQLLPHQLAGMTLIGLGLIATDGKVWRRLAGDGNTKDIPS